jgi:hypothetical protein
MIEGQQSCSSSNGSSRKTIQRIGTAQDARSFENRETSEEFSSDCALEETRSAMKLPRAMHREYGLFPDIRLLEASTVASLSTSATDISILENATTPSPHTTETEGCFEYSTFSILSKAHLTLLEDFKSAQLIPRNPSLANLLLLDIHSDLVVYVLGSTFKLQSPTMLADSMAAYFITYRLLRVRSSSSYHFQNIPSLSSSR